MSSLKEIIEKISKGSGRPEKEIEKLIQEKKEELSGLVSDEGAAYIVGNELGVSLLKETKRQLKVKSLVSGLRSVDLVGKIVRVFEPREFERDGKKGRVANVLVGDETGIVRLSLWNEETGLISEGKVKDGDVIRITRGYVKTDNRGNPELRIGKGRVDKVDEEITLPSIQEMKEEFSVARRKPIGGLREGDFAEVKACLVQVFRKNPFYEVCPECGARVTRQEAEGETWACREHGEVKPEHQMVVSGVIDDGTGNIRAVFFRDVAEQVFGRKAEELRKGLEGKEPASLFDSFTGLGKDLIMKGRVRMNEFSERTEMVVNEIAEVDVKKECSELIKELEVKGE